MKKYFFLFLVMSYTFSYSQLSLPFDFETSPVSSDFVDFGGGTASVIVNPHSSALNSSTKVAQIIRNGGEVYAGSKLILENYLDFSSLNGISMKVFSPAAGITVKFKLEGEGIYERDVTTTMANQWETLTWDFSGLSLNTYNEVVFMFDFGNIGAGGPESTFLFDDITQINLGDPVDLPIDFQNENINYALTDFGGNSSLLIEDPNNTGNMIVQTTKTDAAATWAGTTMSTNAGFLSPIPVTQNSTKMYVHVWSPDANIPIRLKIEDSNDPTRSVETQILNTTANTWEVLEFDFTNQATGTAALNVNYTFNMASIFFNFGSEGTVPEKIYYFDNISFGTPLPLGLDSVVSKNFTIFPNPSRNLWFVKSREQMTKVNIFDMKGSKVFELNPNSRDAFINASLLSEGIYLAKIQLVSGVQQTLKLIKK